MPDTVAQWPGFVDEPCADCEHVGHNHQPRCMTWVQRKGRDDYCGCPAYRATAAQQISLIDTTRPHQEVT